MESEKLNVQEVEEDDGPPPGFQCIINNPNLVDFKNVEPTLDEDEDEDDGPPPGFEPVAPIAQLSVLSSDKEKSDKQEDIDDEDGPPPGWEFSSLSRALPEPSSIATDIKIEESEELNVDEEDDDSSPPGWPKVLPHHMPPPCVPQAQQSSNDSSDLQLRSNQDVAKNNDQEPQIVSENNLTGQSSPPEPVQHPQPSTLLGGIPFERRRPIIYLKFIHFVHELKFTYVVMCTNLIDASCLLCIIYENTDTKREEKEELNVDEEDDDDDAPPPGWENVLPHQMPPPCVPQVQKSSNVSFDLQFGREHDVAENNDKEPQIASQYNLIPGQSSPHKPPVQQPQPSTHPVSGKVVTRNRIKRPSTGNKPVSSVPLPPVPAATSSSTARSS